MHMTVPVRRLMTVVALGMAMAAAPPARAEAIEISPSQLGPAVISGEPADGPAGGAFTRALSATPQSAAQASGQRSTGYVPHQAAPVEPALTGGRWWPLPAVALTLVLAGWVGYTAHRRPRQR
jgi:hypothetical protein